MLNGLPAEMLLPLGAAGLVLVDGEDVVLTAPGLAWALCLGLGVPAGTAAVPAAFGFPLPFFNEKDHELWYDGGLVKRLREDTGNQAVLLAAFQEAGWRRCISNPLPEDAEGDRQEQFRDAVRRLNSSQGNGRVHEGDAPVVRAGFGQAWFEFLVEERALRAGMALGCDLGGKGHGGDPVVRQAQPAAEAADLGFSATNVGAFLAEGLRSADRGGLFAAVVLQWRRGDSPRGRADLQH